jgi:predicted RNase H-like HicB family nuclease
MSRIVNVTYHQEPEGWWAESIDAPAFFATGESRAEVRRRVFEHLPSALGIAPDETPEFQEAEIFVGAALVPIDRAEEPEALPEGTTLGWFARFGENSPEGA